MILDIEEFRKVLVSIIPPRKEEMNPLTMGFMDAEELVEHRAEVRAWNEARECAINKADEVFRKALADVRGTS